MRHGDCIYFKLKDNPISAEQGIGTCTAPVPCWVDFQVFIIRHEEVECEAFRPRITEPCTTAATATSFKCENCEEKYEADRECIICGGEVIEEDN